MSGDVVHVAEHGGSGYSSGCRCEKCKAAHALRQKRYREKKKQQIAEGVATITHGLAGYTNYACRCQVCRDAYRDYALERGHPESSSDAWRDWQAKTTREASNHGKEWTGPELEIVARGDLSAHEVAAMLGRTYAAVQSIRRKLHNDPKTINFAGIDSRAADR